MLPAAAFGGRLEKRCLSTLEADRTVAPRPAERHPKG